MAVGRKAHHRISVCDSQPLGSRYSILSMSAHLCLGTPWTPGNGELQQSLAVFCVQSLGRPLSLPSHNSHSNLQNRSFHCYTVSKKLFQRLFTEPLLWPAAVLGVGATALLQTDHCWPYVSYSLVGESGNR